jgi:hypothetical protein
MMTIEDMQAMHVFGTDREKGDARSVLAEAAALRQALADARGGRFLPDSVEDIRQIRNERAGL